MEDQKEYSNDSRKLIEQILAGDEKGSDETLSRILRAKTKERLQREMFED